MIHKVLYLPNAVLEEHDHPHPGVALLDELHDGLVIGLFHVAAVDGQDDIALAHSRPVGRTAILHIVDVGDHLQLLVALVVDAIALQGESIRVVLLLHDYRASPSILVRLGGQEALRLVAPQDVGGAGQLKGG